MCVPVQPILNTNQCAEIEPTNRNALSCLTLVCYWLSGFGTFPVGHFSHTSDVTGCRILWRALSGPASPPGQLSATGTGNFRFLYFYKVIDDFLSRFLQATYEISGNLLYTTVIYNTHKFIFPCKTAKSFPFKFI